MPGNKDVVRDWMNELYQRNARKELAKGNLSAADKHVDRSKFKQNVKAAQRQSKARGGAGGTDFDSFREANDMSESAFPDLKMTVEDQVEEGDRVVTRWTAQGTHQGPFYGVAPTGKQVSIQGITIHRVQGNKIVEQWNVVDTLDLMQQLGALPEAG